MNLSLTEVAVCLVPVVLIIAVIVLIYINQRKRSGEMRANPSESVESTASQAEPDQQALDGTSQAVKKAPVVEDPVGTQNSLATTSVLLGFLSILVFAIPILIRQGTWCMSYSFIIALVAIGTGIGALVQIKKKGSQGKGTAILGIVLGVLFFVIVVCWISGILLQ